MTPDDLAKHGKALYGERNWQSELATNLSVSPRTIRRWLFNGLPIPDGVQDDIRVMLKNKYEELTELLRVNFHECGPILPKDSLKQH